MSLIADRLVQVDDFDSQALRATDTAAVRLQTRIVDGPEWDRTIAGFDEVCQEQMHAFAATRWPSVRMVSTCARSMCR